MKARTIIPFLTGVLLSGPALAGPGGKPMVIDGQPVEAMLILLPGGREFGMFVEPKGLKKATVIEAVRRMAGGYCRKTFGNGRIALSKLKRGSWAVPEAWNIKGRCE